eukprot:TRINITY_DN9022_c0_g1_i1.p1 TRINITY_DN9022_c0_g1~~TRINITY_DN9022_c0_g1_i1.p1  ORF type:complete len:127 (-),score=33.65 TRINITY_DN9022_c0_g1_i1:76-456(-)
MLASVEALFASRSTAILERYHGALLAQRSRSIESEQGGGNKADLSGLVDALKQLIAAEKKRTKYLQNLKVEVESLAFAVQVAAATHAGARSAGRSAAWGALPLQAMPAAGNSAGSAGGRRKRSLKD